MARVGDILQGRKVQEGFMCPVNFEIRNDLLLEVDQNVLQRIFGYLCNITLSARRALNMADMRWGMRLTITHGHGVPKSSVAPLILCSDTTLPLLK